MPPQPQLPPAGTPQHTRGLENLSSPQLPSRGKTLAGEHPRPLGSRKVGVGVLVLPPPFTGSAENQIALSETPSSDWLTK